MDKRLKMVGYRSDRRGRRPRRGFISTRPTAGSDAFSGLRVPAERQPDQGTPPSRASQGDPAWHTCLSGDAPIAQNKAKSQAGTRMSKDRHWREQRDHPGQSFETKPISILGCEGTTGGRAGECELPRSYSRQTNPIQPKQDWSTSTFLEMSYGDLHRTRDSTKQSQFPAGPGGLRLAGRGPCGSSLRPSPPPASGRLQAFRAKQSQFPGRGRNGGQPVWAGLA